MDRAEPPSSASRNLNTVFFPLVLRCDFTGTLRPRTLLEVVSVKQRQNHGWPLKEKHEAKERPVPAFHVSSSRPPQPLTALSPSPFPPHTSSSAALPVSVSSPTSRPVAAASEVGPPPCSLVLMPHVQGLCSRSPLQSAP